MRSHKKSGYVSEVLLDSPATDGFFKEGMTVGEGLGVHGELEVAAVAGRMGQEEIVG